MDSPSVVIRPLEPNEYPLIADFCYEAIHVPEGATPPPRTILDDPALQAYLKDFGKKAGDMAFAAEIDGKVVGVAWSRIMDSYGSIDDETPALAIAVLANNRSSGVGTSLLETLLAGLAKAGYTQASLSVQRDNPALHLYERLGFTVHEDKGDELILVHPLA